jgi:hypothetical protein
MVGHQAVADQFYPVQGNALLQKIQISDSPATPHHLLMEFQQFGVGGSPLLSRGEQRFSVSETSWTLMMRFSAGLEDPGLKPVLSE